MHSMIRCPVSKRATSALVRLASAEHHKNACKDHITLDQQISIVEAWQCIDLPSGCLQGVPTVSYPCASRNTHTAQQRHGRGCWRARSRPRPGHGCQRVGLRQAAAADCTAQAAVRAFHMRPWHSSWASL